MLRPSARSRLLANSDAGAHGCRLWRGPTWNFGYGYIYVGKRIWSTHRLAWHTWRGRIPTGQCVLHRCDTPTCIEPTHLFLGTRADNMRDMHRKGRGNVRSNGRKFGEPSRMNEVAVRVIRLLSSRGVSRSALARAHGISVSYVTNIVARKNWRHVP